MSLPTIIYVGVAINLLTMLALLLMAILSTSPRQGAVRNWLKTNMGTVSKVCIGLQILSVLVFIVCALAANSYAVLTVGYVFVSFAACLIAYTIITRSRDLSDREVTMLL
jgi:hypothetical protein